jgi:TRAP-type C4-dicarboxylate transport system permease small subunit
VANDRSDGLDAEAIPREEPEAAQVLRRLNDLVGTVETGVLVILVAVLVGGAVYQVLAEQVLDRRETWPYELIRYGVFFVAMSGAALAAQRQGMFHMDLVTRLFPARMRSALRILTALLVIAMCGLVISSGLDLRRGSYQLNEGFEVISTAHGYVALVIAFGLIGLHYALHAAIEVVYLANHRLPPEPPHGGH